MGRSGVAVVAVVGSDCGVGDIAGVPPSCISGVVGAGLAGFVSFCRWSVRECCAVQVDHSVPVASPAGGASGGASSKVGGVSATVAELGGFRDAEALSSAVMVGLGLWHRMQVPWSGQRCPIREPERSYPHW